MSRIGAALKGLQRTGRKAFIPYVMAGAPSLEATREAVLALADAGADIIELGVPFTDPVADGPTIQRAAEQALAQGVTLRKVMALAGELRQGGLKTPIVLMTYYTPVFKYGPEAFARDAARAGVDGLIIPDLPPDEAGELLEHTRPQGVDIIFLLAPNSPEHRIRKVARASSGFIYYVSIMGITGAALDITPQMALNVAHIKEVGRKPVALGFGVSTPEEARMVAGLADGVIVGSALVKRLGSPDFKAFAESLRGAI